jgi:hypothetical protein
MTSSCDGIIWLEGRQYYAESIGPERNHICLISRRKLVSCDFDICIKIDSALQLPVEHWHAYIGEATLADAILDRLLHNAHRLPLKGESMRKHRAQTAAEEAVAP